MSDTYIKLSTGEYPRHIGDIQIDPAGATDYAPVEWVDRPAINFERERAYVGQPVQTNGQWFTNWVVTPIPDSEQAEKVRAQRDELLTKSDWSQLPDSPVDKAVWATYRQALRDLPSQSGFPWAVTWPPSIKVLTNN
jgi:hypothetical protein